MGMNEQSREQEIIARQKEKQKMRIEIDRIDKELEFERRLHEVKK